MTNGLTKTLSLSDLVLFGITSIMGSGGFNLIGNAIKEGGTYFPLTLLLSGVLFGGSAHSYAYANDVYKNNISETLLIESSLGSMGKYTSVFAIILYNIFVIATILVLSSKMLFPNATYITQVSFSFILLSIMAMLSFQNLDVNKDIVNIFSYAIIVLLGFTSLLGIGGLFQNTVELPKFPEKINIYESFLFFFFVLAGHDNMIKFSEEANNNKDIEKSMYLSILISVIFTVGICLAAVAWVHDFRNIDINNIIAYIYDKTLHHNAGKYISFISLIFMIGTTFLGFLSTVRYIYGIPKDIKYFEFLREGGDGHVSGRSILLTAILCLSAILINQTTSLVEFADIGLIIVLLLVAVSSFISKLKTNHISIIDGLTSLGFTSVLGLIINKHLF